VSLDPVPFHQLGDNIAISGDPDAVGELPGYLYRPDDERNSRNGEEVLVLDSLRSRPSRDECLEFCHVETLPGESLSV